MILPDLRRKGVEDLNASLKKAGVDIENKETDGDFDPFMTLNFISSLYFDTFARPFKTKSYNILLYFICFPCEFLLHVFICYIGIPFIALKAGLILAWKGKLDQNFKVTKHHTAGSIPGLKQGASRQLSSGPLLLPPSDRKVETQPPSEPKNANISSVEGEKVF